MTTPTIRQSNKVNFKKSKKRRDNYQNIKFRRIIYTKDDREKYGNEIPNVVNKLGDNFCHSHIKEIKIPDSIVEIGDRCFYNCQLLTSITISSLIIGYA